MTPQKKLSLKRDVALVEMSGDELAAVRGLSISCPIKEILDATNEFADAAKAYVRALSEAIGSPCTDPIHA